MERPGGTVTRVDDPSPYAGVRGRGKTVATISAGSPGEAAGLMIGDELIAVNGQKVESLDALDTAGDPGDTLRLSLFRRGQLIEREHA